jgi:hypothetical protein
MPEVIRLSSGLVMQAREAGKASGRSPSQQIEHWVRLGKIAEDFPELTALNLLNILNPNALKPNGH